MRVKSKAKRIVRVKSKPKRNVRVKSKDQTMKKMPNFGEGGGSNLAQIGQCWYTKKLKTDIEATRHDPDLP